MATNTKNQPRKQLGGGTKRDTDIRGARRDAERILVTDGAESAKKMLRNTYDFSKDRAQKLVSEIKGKK